MFGYWNKALGFCEPVTEDVVGPVLERGRVLGLPAVGLLLQPRVQPRDWESTAEGLGLTRGTTRDS